MPDFIYERKSYLDFSVLIASRILKIPHFYESNGLQFKSREKYYNSSFKFINKFIEKFMYKSSSYVFFVGSYGDFWKINKLNWINVENGIESRFITEINDEIEKNNIIDICFIGRYMSHHRLDILIDGLYKIKDKGLKFRINLIGSGLVEVEKQIRDFGLPVINHGYIMRKELIIKVKKFDIGVICGSPEFQSCMKLFNYAAGSCAVIAPSNYNLEKNFKNEIIFFDGTSSDFATKLSNLISDNNKQKIFGKKLQQKVKENYTWEKIFTKKIKIIKSIIH